MKVEIFNYNNPESKPRLICTWTLDTSGAAVCDNSIDQEDMETSGAISSGKTYYPKDGAAFLRALPIEYSSSSFTEALLTESTQRFVTGNAADFVASQDSTL
jgi:hypothetical protein